MTISDWTRRATAKLSRAKIPSARLGAELILARALTHFYAQKSRNFPEISRAFLLIHDEKIVPKSAEFHANRLLNLRARHVPLAYIFREKEFYGREFFVDENVLIPRPESEDFLAILHEILPKIAPKNDKKSTKNRTKIAENPPEKIAAPRKIRLLDVGTGSGILAITSALEFPLFDVSASDISAKSLVGAQKHAARYGAKISFRESDLLENFSRADDEKFDVIVASLPYVAREWHAENASPELRAEPEIALFASDRGTALNKKLVSNAGAFLRDDGILVLEMDPEQLDEIAEFAQNFGFCELSRKKFHLALKKSK